MKQETNNEMDLLLRRLGRRDEATVSPADHLDADELSAYAENALPAAARTRYTMHLAECASCRNLVVQLSSSAGVVAATDSAVTEPSGFKKFLASLFTPMVLRYAVPALALIVVAAIGFVALRRDRAAKYVAQDTNAAREQVVTPTAEPLRGFSDTPSNTGVNPEKAVERQEKKQPEQPAPPPNAPPVVSNVDTNLAKEKAAAQSKPEEQRAAANEPPPAKPQPSATPEQSPGSADTDVSKREVQEFRAAAPATRVLQSAEREDRKTDNAARARRPADSVSVEGAGAGQVVNIQPQGAADSSANTKTVAGRRFRKQAGVWTDTAYDSSKDAVTLTRGSEQYRALIADEPQIKTIAEALDGEILLVWKGRTYRIR